MEAVHDFGISLILQLQNVFKNHESEMLFLSRLGDPRNSFLVYFPVAYHVDCSLGLTVLWTFIFSEWFNLVFKWILRGERPYWWIHENPKWQNSDVKQFELTCETGPGSPSGHSMVTAAVFFVILINVMKYVQGHNSVTRRPVLKTLLTLCVWSVFAILMVLVSFSRVFIATHFPHQVTMGVLSGIVLAYCLQNTRLSKATSLVYCLSLTVVLLCFTMMIYKFLSMVVYDPSMTLKKAQKWCADPSYIHLDTTPFYALVRDLGAAMGIGLSYYLIRILSRKVLFFKDGLNSSNSPNNSSLRVNFFLRSTNAVVSLVLLKLLETVSASQSNLMIFYITGYIRNAISTTVVMAIVPLLTQAIFQVFTSTGNRNKNS